MLKAAAAYFWDCVVFLTEALFPLDFFQSAESKLGASGFRNMNF